MAMFPFFVSTVSFRVGLHYFSIISIYLFISTDSCKFLHDRSDYKHGWQLEREMEQGTYGHGGKFR